MDIKFPTNELKPEDYGQVQLFGFKEYYKNYFPEVIYKVSLIIFILKLLFLDLWREKKNYIC